jgi:hypothetical protein
MKVSGRKWYLKEDNIRAIFSLPTRDERRNPQSHWVDNFEGSVLNI